MSRPRITPQLTAHLVAVALAVASVGGCTRNYPGYPPAGYPAAYPGTAPGVAPGAAPGVGAAAPAGATGPQSVFAGQQTNPQFVQLQQRVANLDADNRQLTSQVAQLQQQNQALTSQKDLLAQQLQDSVDQYKQLASTSQQYAQQARGMQASIAARGGARLTANNSLQSSAAGVVISGAQVVQDGQVIRIRLPADRIFTPGSAALTAEGTRQLDEVASVITQRFARQRVAVEGHTDSGQVYSGFGTPFKLAGEQAQTVMDQLVQRNRLPPQQLFVVAHGPNHPVADNRNDFGRSANRRIEIVVYPDSF